MLKKCPNLNGRMLYPPLHLSKIKLGPGPISFGFLDDFSKKRVWVDFIPATKIQIVLFKIKL
jgi:hypothetical protein